MCAHENVTPLIAPEAVSELAAIYRDFERAFPRVKSRAAIDGGLMLLALVDELRQLRKAVEDGQAGERGRP